MARQIDQVLLPRWDAGCFWDPSASIGQRCSDKDTAPPNFQNCPLNFTVGNIYDTAGAIVSWVPIGALDNGERVEVEQASLLGSGSNFPIGETEVKYTAHDPAGNSASCLFWVVTYCPPDWHEVHHAGPDEIKQGQDGRYYAAAIWPQPQAYDNQGYSWSYESTTIIRNHAATAANIPKSKYNNEAVGRTPFVAGGGIGAVDNSGVFPVGDGVVTTVTYIAADAAGNEAKCTLDVEVTTTFISRFSKIARYIPAKSAADPDSDAESKGDTAAVWVASSTLARFPVGVSGEVCAEKCHKWTNTNETCNYFVQTNGAQGSCILLSLSVSDQPTNSPVGAGFAGHGWEFSFNSDWDTYRRTSTTSLNCAHADKAAGCIANLDFNFDVVQALEATGIPTTAEASSCLDAVANSWEKCITPALAGVEGSSCEWALRLYTAKRDAYNARCRGELPPAGSYSQLSDTSCSVDGPFFEGLEDCRYICCDAVYNRAPGQCTIISESGIGEQSLECLAAANARRQMCTERCIRARPFGPEDETSAIASAIEPKDLADFENLFGEQAFFNGTAGTPPTGYGDFEFTVSMLGGLRVEGPPEESVSAAWSTVSSATARAAVMLALEDVFGLQPGAVHLTTAYNTTNGVNFTVIKAASRIERATALIDFEELATAPDRAAFMFASTQPAGSTESVGDSFVGAPVTVLSESYWEMLQRRLHHHDSFTFPDPAMTASTPSTAGLESGVMFEFEISDALEAKLKATTTQAPVTTRPEFNRTDTNEGSTTSSSGQTDESRTGQDSQMSNSLVAFIVILVIGFVIAAVVVIIVRKNHKSVGVSSTGVPFKQPTPFQALPPQRGIPDYPDRTMDEVNASVPSSMPSTSSPIGVNKADPFTGLDNTPLETST